jgi:hypothetical protein
VKYDLLYVLVPGYGLTCCILGMWVGSMQPRDAMPFAAPFIALPPACTLDGCAKIQTDACVYHQGAGFEAMSWCRRIP